MLLYIVVRSNFFLVKLMETTFICNNQICRLLTTKFKMQVEISLPINGGENMT